MTIKQIIKYLPAPICGSTVIDSEKQKEYDAHDLAVIILLKYQKIEQIVKNTDAMTGSNGYACAFIKIKEVVKDGND